MARLGFAFQEATISGFGRRVAVLAVLYRGRYSLYEFNDHWTTSGAWLNGWHTTRGGEIADAPALLDLANKIVRIETEGGGHWVRFKLTVFSHRQAIYEKTSDLAETALFSWTEPTVVMATVRKVTKSLGNAAVPWGAGSEIAKELIGPVRRPSRGPKLERWQVADGGHPSER